MRLKADLQLANLCTFFSVSNLFLFAEKSTLKRREELFAVNTHFWDNFIYVDREWWRYTGFSCSYKVFHRSIFSISYAHRRRERVRPENWWLLCRIYSWGNLRWEIYIDLNRSDCKLYCFYHKFQQNTHRASIKDAWRQRVIDGKAIMMSLSDGGG